MKPSIRTCLPIFAAAFILYLSQALLPAQHLVGRTLLSGSADPKPLRLIYEAEDFEPEQGHWTVKDYGTNYYSGTSDVTFLSRGRYLSAPERGASSSAKHVLDVPRAGRFEVLVRYEQPFDYAVEFDVEIQQEGKVVFQRGYGRLGAPKIWCMRGFDQPPQVHQLYNGSDNIVWEGRGAKADLQKGKAVVILKTGPQKSGLPARRNIDVVVLTDDEAGIERQIEVVSRGLPMDGWLTQAGDVFMNVRNPAGGQAGLAVEVGGCDETTLSALMGRQWPGKLSIGKETDKKPLKPELYLKPGETSADVEVGRFFDTLNDFQWQVKVVRSDGKPAAGGKVRLAFSVLTREGQREVLRDDVFTVGSDNTITFFLDGDLRRTKRIRTVEEDLEQLAKLVKGFPKKGKRPERFLIYGMMGSYVLKQPGRVGDLCREIALGLGMNALREVKMPVRNAILDVEVAKWDVARRDFPTFWKDLKDGGLSERVKIIVDCGFDGVDAKSEEPANQQAFREFLKKKDVSPTELGLKSLDEAKLEFYDRQSSTSYYWSQVFLTEKLIARMKENTDLARANLPPGVLIQTDTTLYHYDRPEEAGWARVFKRGASQVPWAEDYSWEIPEASPMVTGYLLDALRCGARHHELPLEWRPRPRYPGNIPDNLRRAYYTAIGHGAKIINFVGATPSSVTYSDSVRSDAIAMWKTIHDLVHETGQFEGVVFPASVRQPQVGLLLSFASDLWERELVPAEVAAADWKRANTQDLWNRDSAYNHERKCLYYALRLSQFGVDFVTEEDIQEGNIKHLKLLYIAGNHLETATAKVLQDWVRTGGVLVGVAGGGFLNEHNKPMNLLHEVYGIKDQKIERRDTRILSKQQLPRLQPLDTITWLRPKRQFPALAIKQTVTAVDNTQVLATFGDGKPAITRHPYGQGFAYLFNSLVASAYIRQGIPQRPYERGTRPTSFNHFLPTDLDGELGDIITAPCGSADIPYDVIIDAPFVEVCILESPNGIAITLVNWTPLPQNVNLTIQYVPPGFNFATSLQRGPLDSIRIGKNVTIKTRVDVADMILLEK